MISARNLPDEVLDNMDLIIEDAQQAAFGKIAEHLDALGYPVTGDISPHESLILDRDFGLYVRMMALNNTDIQALNE